MKYLKHLILILLIINFCLSNEYFTPFLLTQNLSSEPFPTEPTAKNKSTGIFQKRRNRRHPADTLPGRTRSGIIAAEFIGSFVGGIGGALIGGFCGYRLASLSGASQGLG